MPSPVALSASGKPVRAGDFAVVQGQITAVSGTGSNATLTVKLNGSGNTITVSSKDVQASQSL